MRIKPEEFAGKWVSNLLGNPDHYQFILKARKGAKEDLVDIDYINLRNAGKILFYDGQVYTYYTLGAPIKVEFEISRLNQRLVKAIFRHF